MAMVERGPSLETHDSPLMSLILSSSSTNTLKHVDPQILSAHEYLSSLTSRSLADLRSQPAALSTVKTSLNTQLSSLCSQHVSSFAQVHRATSSLPSSLNALDTALQSLIERDLPALSNVAQQFSQQIEAPLQAKGKAQNLLSQHDLMLKDLLDIPRLLMTCVRANHPVEALQLAVHMRKLAARNQNSSVHKALQEECWTHLKRLREDLLRGLGARGLRLPAAKRLISLLRKFKEIDAAGTLDEIAMGVSSLSSAEKLSLSDSIICLSFLRSRWTLIEELTSNASTAKSTSILSLHLSTWRDVVGDTCGLAQALFSNSSTDQEDELLPDTLVFLFSHQALSTLHQILSEAIPSLREEANSLQENFDTLAAIHTQLAYSAASLARQGLEISRIVSGQDLLQLEVVNLWTNALIESRATFERCRVGKSASDCLSWIVEDKVQDVLSLELRSFSAADEWTQRVRHFPDLVVLVNSLLQCYNALLSFAPQTTGRQVINAFDSTLSQIVTSMLSAIEKNERVEPSLSLSPILSSNMRSRYFENDTARQSEASMAILGRVLTGLCGIEIYVRGLLVDLYSLDIVEEMMLSDVKSKAVEWAQQADDVWIKSEQARRERVRVEEEELAAEEQRQREEEQARAVEIERKRAEEALKRQEEERQRLIEAKRAEEEEAEKRRDAEIQEAKRLEESARQEMERKEAEEVRRKKEAEEEAQRAKKAQEAAERAGRIEEEARKAREAEDEVRRVVEAEQEAVKLKEAEAEVKLQREAEEAMQRQEEEMPEAQEVDAKDEDKEESDEVGKDFVAQDGILQRDVQVGELVKEQQPEEEANVKEPGTKAKDKTSIPIADEDGDGEEASEEAQAASTE